MQYNFRGSYNSSNNYVKKDVVSYQTTVNDPVRYYFCLTDHTSVSPQTPLVGADSAYWGVINALSNFPNSVDTFLYRTTIQESDKPEINRISELSLKQSLTTAEQDELNTLTTKHRTKYFLAEDANALQESISNLQMFFKTNVEGYISTKQAEFDTAASDAVTSIQTTKDQALIDIEQKKQNVIDYMDSTTAGELRNDIGILGDLLTTDKTSLVNATNSHVTDYIQHPAYATATGTANVYEVTLTPAPTAYVDGMGVIVKINVENTGASTINANLLGAVPIKKPNGNDLGSGNLKVGSVYSLRYNGINFILQGEGGEYGTATSSDVLTGKTIGTENGIVSGTMPDNGTLSYTPSASLQSIPAGHTSGGSVAAVTVDASKVLTGTTIAGTAGTMPNKGAKTFIPSASTQSDAAGYYSSVTVNAVSNLSAGNIKDGAIVGGVTGTFSETASPPAVGDILTGKVAFANGAQINGTMPNRGAPTWTPSTVNQGLSAGYYSGGTVLGDPELIASNIRNGVNIFNVIGNLVASTSAFATGKGTSPDTLQITGLAFQPQIIVIYYTGSASPDIDSAPRTGDLTGITVIIDANGWQFVTWRSTGQGSQYLSMDSFATQSVSITASGFSVKGKGQDKYRYFAWRL